jgi:hypothetical protein
MTDSAKKTLSRENFDGIWLEDTQPSNYTKLTHKPLQEKENLRDDVIPHLRQAIIDHHINRLRIADWLLM